MAGEGGWLVEEAKKILCESEECEIQEMSVQNDDIHLVLSIPLKVKVSDSMGILKGKLLIKMFKSYPKYNQKPYCGSRFWASSYFVTMAGVDEEIINRYVKYQEEEEKRIIE